MSLILLGNLDIKSLKSDRLTEGKKKYGDVKALMNT